MQQTVTRQRTSTMEAVRYVENRLLGDLLAIHEKFEMTTEERMRFLAHDVGVGLAHDCLDSLSIFLYRPGDYEFHRAYVYHRVAPGSFVHSPHSGRIARDSSLVGGRIDFELLPRDRPQWERLKQLGRLQLRWKPSRGRSMHGMYEQADGGYASGDVGISRTCFTK